MTTVLYEQLGYFDTYLVVSSFVLILGVLPMMFVPRNATDCDATNCNETVSCSISYREIMSNFKSANALVGVFSSIYLSYYVEPMIASYMES